MVDAWESLQDEYQRTAVVLDHFDEEINGGPDGGVLCSDGTRRKVRIMLLAGGDLIQSMGEPGVWADVDVSYGKVAGCGGRSVLCMLTLSVCNDAQLNHILGKYGCMIVERTGADVWSFLLSHDLLWRYRKNLKIVKQVRCLGVFRRDYFLDCITYQTSATLPTPYAFSPIRRSSMTFHQARYASLCGEDRASSTSCRILSSTISRGISCIGCRASSTLNRRMQTSNRCEEPRRSASIHALRLSPSWLLSWITDQPCRIINHRESEYRIHPHVLLCFLVSSTLLHCSCRAQGL